MPGRFRPHVALLPCPAHAKPPPTPRAALSPPPSDPTFPVLFRSEQHIVTPRVPTATPTPPHLSRTQSHTSHRHNSAATCRADRTARPQRLSAPSVSTPGGCHLPRCPSRLPACAPPALPAPLRAPATWAERHSLSFLARMAMEMITKELAIDMNEDGTNTVYMTAWGRESDPLPTGRRDDAGGS